MNPRKYIFLLVVSLYSLVASADHLLGGEITWECKGNGAFEFTLKIYRDCQGIPMNNTTEYINGPFGQILVNKVATNDISPTCYGGGSGYSCDPSIPMANVVAGSVEEHIFKGTTFLSGTPPANGWEFSWSSCCRPTVLTWNGILRNTNTQNYFLRSTMYPYTPPGATGPLTVNTCYDSSPYFLESPLSVVCIGNTFTHTQLAGDKEIDSLSFGWSNPLQGSGNAIVWSAGYSMSAPYPDQSESPLNGPVTLNPVSGEIVTSVYALPGNQTGSFASCIRVEAWRDCQKIAEIFRDFAIIFEQNCNPNNKPTLIIDTAQYPDITRNATLYSTKVYPGQQVYFEISAQDFDYNTTSGGVLIPQNIIFQAGGLQVNPQNYGSASGCDGTPPCAQITPKAPQSSYSQALNNNVIFQWTPDCQHLAAPTSCGGINSVYSFIFRMQDDGCATPAISVSTLLVEVIPGDPAPIESICLQALDNDQAKISWKKAVLDSALLFNYYVILGINGSGQVDTIDHVYNIDSLSLIINQASNYTGFYIINSNGQCDFQSQPSDTLSLMNLSLTALPPGNAEFADLSWTPLMSTPPTTSTGLYEIWTEAPAGSGNWVYVASTPNLIYTDQVTVCGSDVNYQVRVYDTVTGCYSASNLDSAFFSDQTNNDLMVLDSASVNANGNATIAWQPTTSGDVVEYYLYFNDPVLGWIVVDTIPAGSAMPWEWTGSDADLRPEEFKVISVDSCGNQSDDQVVLAHKTIYLRGYIDKCEAFAKIGWSQYQGWGNGAVGAYQLQVQTTVGGATSGWQTLFVGSAADTSYIQYNLKNQTEYCFRVKAIDTSGTRISTSNRMCRLATVPQKSKILYMAQVTNDFNRGSVELNFLIDGQADVESFDIERAPHFMGPYEIIGNVGKPTLPPYLISFGDYGADPVRFHYYYRVSATDSCGGRDTLSNIGRNIIVKVQERENLTNFLQWNHYDTWGGGVANYNIYRKGGDEVVFTKVGQVQGNDTTYTDNIKDYADTKGNFCYYVEAVEGPNPLGVLDENGNPYVSLSNQVCMNQTAKVFMATAFRPKSDLVINQTYGPSLRFTDVEKYHFYIMNRWGVMVFETNNPEERWDGTTENGEASQDVYIYYLQFATPGDRPVEQRGTFTLIR